MKIFDKIKQVISGATEKVSSSLTDSLGLENADFKKVIVSTRNECLKMNEHFYDVKLSGIDAYQNEVQNWSDDKKTDFLLYCPSETDAYAKHNRDTRSEEYKDNVVRDAYLTQLLRTKIHYQDEGIIRIIDAFFTKKRYGRWSTFSQWPIALFINQLLNQ